MTSGETPWVVEVILGEEVFNEMEAGPMGRRHRPTGGGGGARGGMADEGETHG